MEQLEQRLMRLEYFEMIDRVEEIDPDAGRIAVFSRVPEKSTVFEGHFPGHPLVPGVLLIEAMAQAAGYLILARENFRRMTFLAAVKEAKLRTFVEPRTDLLVTSEIEHDGAGYTMSKTAITAGGKKICNARLTHRTLPFENETLQKHVLERARQTGLLREG
jgi:3-hydroxyacyl-[acyl-carrier-protein] dehydratase